MTIKDITNQLDRISADSWYTVKDDCIELTINDFERFDENRSKIIRKYTDPDTVGEVLGWLVSNADFIEENFYLYLFFGDNVVRISSTSLEA